MPKTKTSTPRAARTSTISHPTAPPAAADNPNQVAAKPTKLGLIAMLVSRPDGARTEELMAATGWQAHSVRGALAGGIKKQLKLNVTSQKTETGRVYRVINEVQQ